MNNTTNANFKIIFGFRCKVNNSPVPNLDGDMTIEYFKSTEEKAVEIFDSDVAKIREYRRRGIVKFNLEVSPATADENGNTLYAFGECVSYIRNYNRENFDELDLCSEKGFNSGEYKPRIGVRLDALYEEILYYGFVHRGYNLVSITLLETKDNVAVNVVKSVTF